MRKPTFQAVAVYLLSVLSITLAQGQGKAAAGAAKPSDFAPLARLDSTESAIEIYKRIGKASLHPFHKQAKGSAPQSQPLTQYAHLIMRPIADSVVFAAMISKTGMTVLNQYPHFPRPSNGKVYESWVIYTGKAGYAKVFEILSTEFKEHFFNMRAFDVDDKWSPKMKGLREFEAKEKDGKSGMVFGQVDFFGNVPAARRNELLTQYLLPQEIYGITYWKGHLQAFQTLANLDEVRSVEERDTGLYVTNDKSRSLLRVSNIQWVPTNVTAPKTNWLDTGVYQNQYYGRGIEVGIYDSGIDNFGAATTTWANDFWERDASNIARLRRGNTSIGWENWRFDSTVSDAEILHGTHVAGIVGGNGWLSFSNGAPTPYLWRGIAPKVSFLARSRAYTGFEGHVNNHSHVITTLGDYDKDCAAVDSAVNNHANTHTMVYSAANNGLSGYGVQRGYYSILADTKNAITVGATYHDTVLRAYFSSQGPTRDGRIKPDVMAPGASMEWPDRSITPMYIEIDSLYFKRQNGTKVKVYDFNALEGWTSEYGISAITVNASRLIANQNWIGGFIKNDAVTAYTTNSTDSMVIRYRITHTTHIPSKMTALRCGLSWNQSGSAGLDSLQYNLSTPGGSAWQTRRFRLSNLRGRKNDADLSIGMARWPTSNTAINKLRLSFWSDSTNAIHSTSVADTTAAKRYPKYVQIQGTSMAAPAATGVIALILEKWKKVLAPSANLHTQGPWNSTIKALLIHTATDMVKFAPTPIEKGSGPSGQPVNYDGAASVNPDICGFVSGTGCTAQSAENSWDKYGYGPDYSTGYGLINAEKVMGMIDAGKQSRIRQSSIAQNGVHAYTFDVPANTTKFRVTLAWDDLPGDRTQPLWAMKLVNDLDLVIQDPFGDLARPYSLIPVPQAASVWNNNTPPADGIDPVTHADIPTYAPVGENHLDNVEVVDVGNGSGTLTPGKWKIVVKGYQVMSGQSQAYSLVSDFTNRSVNQSVGWIWNHQYYNSTRICPEGHPSLVLDDEDDSPNGTASLFRSSSSGTMNPPGDENLTFQNWQNTYLRLCREVIDTLSRYRDDYAVFQLSGTCPVNSYPFQIQIDNENTANSNWNSGDIAPSSQSGGNTTLAFCFVPNNGTTTTPPWWAKRQGAFTTVNSTHSNCPLYNWHVEDDEDAIPDNTYVIPSGTSTYATRIKALFNWAGGNTQPDMQYLWNACP